MQLPIRLSGSIQVNPLSPRNETRRAPKASDGIEGLNRKEQRERWDAVARALPDLFPAGSTQYYQRREIALIRRYLGLLKDRKILKLDLWNEAVNTRILQWMQSEGAEVFGLDVSQVTTSRALENFGQKCGDAFLVQADIREIPFKDDSFDFVYSMGTIEHIEEYEQALREVYRVLRRGGRAIIGVPHKWNLFLRPLLVRALERFEKYPYSPEKSFSHGELRLALKRVGFRVQARTGILIFPGILRMVELFGLRRQFSVFKIIAPLLKPFEYLENRWEWVRILGYLIALVVEKIDPPVSSGTPALVSPPEVDR